MMRSVLRATVATAALLAATPGLAEASRTTLPVPPAPFNGVIGATVAQSQPSTTPLASPVQAPAGAPNIVVFMGDDVGFSMSSTFGGPAPTPNMDRLAAMGQRYNRFNTTALCSPSRAALLTGRNHHRVGVGYLTDMPSEYPGYDVHFPASAATIATTLKLNGYNTAMFGKDHNTPHAEESAAGPFNMWPTGIGFEYFFGFVAGDIDQWEPTLYRDTNLVPEQDGPPELLDHRLASDAITWIHNQKAAAPDKPFFIYYAPGSTHAPHQAPPDWIARFKGKFDQGWDKMREETYRRQLAMGIIPPGTKLTPRPAEIPAWDSLSPTQKAFAARAMEVAAAQLAYQDAQFGRVLDELQRMGELDRTLVIVVQGDNGASAEEGPRGSINEMGFISNHIQESDAWLAANVDKLGGPQTYESYPAGWAWAMDAPFRWTKQYADMLGGIRNGMIMAWPGHAAHPGGVCAEFGHLVDVAPTLLDAAHIPAPQSVYGVRQIPYDGQSLLPSLTRCQPDKPRTQYFEMTGKIGLYKNGWFLSSEDGRTPWEATPPPGFDPAKPTWTLYDLRTDFSQSTDVAAQHPDRLKDMIATWRKVAADNHVFPIEHNFGSARLHGGGLPFELRDHYDYWGEDVSVPATSGPMFVGRSFTLNADLDLAKPDASGAVLAVGSRFGGWSLYLDQGRPSFVYAFSTRPEDITRIAAGEPLPPGRSQLRMTFTAEGVGKGAQVEILQGERVLARGHVPRTFFTPAGNGEMLNVGKDTGATVTDYRTPHGKLEGHVSHVSLDFKPVALSHSAPRREQTRPSPRPWLWLQRIAPRPRPLRPSGGGGDLRWRRLSSGWRRRKAYRANL
jgi:arylsulfatase